MVHLKMKEYLDGVKSAVPRLDIIDCYVGGKKAKEKEKKMKTRKHYHFIDKII